MQCYKQEAPVELGDCAERRMKSRRGTPKFSADCRLLAALSLTEGYDLNNNFKGAPGEMVTSSSKFVLQLEAPMEPSF
jgi:hypothetical protein